MKDENLYKTPPPALDGIPDFVHGRLIFKDTTSDDNCKYICYDGRTFYRCPSRAAAERLAARLAEEYKPALENAYLAQHHSTTAAAYLRRAAEENGDAELRLEFEALSVHLRRIADKIDTIISQTK